MRLTLGEWRRDYFAVCLFSPPSATVGLYADLARGVLSGPFAIYAGTPYEVDRRRKASRYTLVHLPSQWPLLTLRRETQCREAAVELGACDLAWEAARPCWFPLGPPKEMVAALDIRSRWAALSPSTPTKPRQVQSRA